MRVHHLFFSTDIDQQTLSRRITPTTDQRAQQQERWNDVHDYLIGDLGEKTGLPMSSWLQGSYKFGTQVRPVKGCEFDIDLGIYFGWQGSPARGPYTPTEIKNLVQASLGRYATEAEDDVLEVLHPPRERCSRIRFSGNFHIDVPSYHLDAGADARSLATQSKGWEISDPKALFLWFRDQFAEDDHAQVRRLIRYLKIWAALNLDTPPSSVVITVLVAEAYVGMRDSEVATDDEAILNVTAAIAARLERDARVSNPVNRNEKLNRLSTDELRVVLDAFDGLVATARIALDAQTEAETAVHWTTAFHHFFPAPREARMAGSTAALVPIAFDPQVAVEAVPKGGLQRFQNTNRIGPIPKDCTIRFTLTNAGQLPAGASVRWIVRNEGAEAEMTNDLGHVAATGLSVEEHSAYRGTHFMDVAVTSAYGTVLGYRRIPVQISGLAMPVRNPKRPGWTKFRKR